jgi:hypothetical protein
MDEPDLSTWLRDWRWSASQGDDAFNGTRSMDPFTIEIDDDDWVILSATTTPDVLRLDMVLEADLAPEVVPFAVKQILHWTFSHPYAEDALQFALAPDSTLIAYTHLMPGPEDGEEAVMQQMLDAVDQAQEAWTLILVDAMLRAHQESTPQSAHTQEAIA